MLVPMTNGNQRGAALKSAVSRLNSLLHHHQREKIRQWTSRVHTIRELVPGSARKNLLVLL